MLTDRRKKVLAVTSIVSVTKVIMTDKTRTFRHDSGILWLSTVLLNAVTSPAMDVSTKTIFEATYGQPPDYDALPPVGCYAVRLLEKQHRKDFISLPVNQVPYSPAATASVDGIQVAAPSTSSALLGRLASDDACQVLM